MGPAFNFKMEPRTRLPKSFIVTALVIGPAVLVLGLPSRHLPSSEVRALSLEAEASPHFRLNGTTTHHSRYFPQPCHCSLPSEVVRSCLGMPTTEFEELWQAVEARAVAKF